MYELVFLADRDALDECVGLCIRNAHQIAHDVVFGAFDLGGAERIARLDLMP